MKLLPSLLYPDFEELTHRLVESLPVSNEVHIDFADGVFVPNTLPDVAKVKSIQGDAAIEAHLMVQDPASWIEAALDDVRFERIIIHAEAFGDIPSLLKRIRGMGRKAGVALKPSTPVAMLTPWAEWLDQVLILSVDPGFNGAPFQPETVEKIAETVKTYPNIDVSADGGMNLETLPLVAKAGATRAAVGSFLHGRGLAEGMQELEAASSGWSNAAMEGLS
jgi:ribulose-phosphate 3-epimerase